MPTPTANIMSFAESAAITDPAQAYIPIVDNSEPAPEDKNKRINAANLLIAIPDMQKVVSDLSERLPEPVIFAASINPTWLMRFLGPLKELVAGIHKDGSFSSYKLNIPTNSILTSNMEMTGELLVSRLVPSIFSQGLSVSSDLRYAYKISGENNKRIFAIPRTGWPIETKVTQAVQSESVSPGSITTDSLDPELSILIGDGAPTPVYIEELGEGPSRTAFINNSATGQRSQVPGTDVHNTEQVGNSVAFDDDSGVRKHVTLAEPATPYRAVPTTNIACYGDSLTAWPGSNWPINVLGAISGATAVNRGVAGQTSTDVACRQGGIKPAVTVTANQIPASGAVSVTAIDPADGWRGGVAFGFVGVLAGIPGTLGRDGSGNWSFTRTTAGSVTACPAGSRFEANQGLSDQEDVQVLWVGRNNVFQDQFANIVLRDIGAMTTQLKTLVKRYVVVSVTNGQFEGNNGATYGKIIGLNEQLAALYPGRYCNLQNYMVNQCIYDLGITPTAQDLANINNGRMPPSIMANSESDPIHFSDDASTKAGEFIRDFILEKGWL